jgi:hypothetical protein
VLAAIFLPRLVRDGFVLGFCTKLVPQLVDLLITSGEVMVILDKSRDLNSLLIRIKQNHLSYHRWAGRPLHSDLGYSGNDDVCSGLSA